MSVNKFTIIDNQYNTRSLKSIYLKVRFGKILLRLNQINTVKIDLTHSRPCVRILYLFKQYSNNRCFSKINKKIIQLYNNNTLYNDNEIHIFKPNFICVRNQL